jgi:hypothetical protein
MPKFRATRTVTTTWLIDADDHDQAKKKLDTEKPVQSDDQVRINQLQDTPATAPGRVAARPKT